MRQTYLISKSRSYTRNVNIQTGYCSFQVLWYFYNVVDLLQTADAFPFRSSQNSALLPDQTPVTLCCCAIGNLEHLHTSFLHSFVSHIDCQIIYLLKLLLSDFCYNIGSFLFLVPPVCMGLLSATLCFKSQNSHC